ncbi:MAG: 2-C-methyl-D-erythritol 4-phosphate cytidylyltransferase [Porticoccaceae bacterium]
MKTWVIVPAAGGGRRFGGPIPKQYLPLAGKPVIQHTLERLLAIEPAALVVVIAADDAHWQRLAVAADPRILVARGGAERADSVRAGLAALAGRAAATDLVLVHDVVRPCVTAADIRALLAAADHPGGALLAAPVSDTLKRVDDNGIVVGTEPRAGLWAALTPQLCRYAMLVAALAQARQSGREFTDEAAALEAAGHAPRVVPGRRDNLKITRPEDLALAAAVLASQEAE